MKKINQVLAAAAVAAATLVVAAQPSSAAVTGTIYNNTSTAGRWIMVSPTWPATTTTKVYPGQAHTAKSFIPLYDCRSPWGYVYRNGTWYAMNTTGTLVLDCD